MLSYSFLIILFLSFCLAGEPDTSAPERDPKLAPGFKGTYEIPGSPKYAYQEALHKSFLFYHAQRSGKIDEHRLAWRSDSCLGCKGKYGEDLSGGWYEAANSMKWTQPFSWTVTQLAYNVYQFGAAMESVNEKAEAMKVVRWGADYLMNAHPKPNVLVGLFGLDADDEGDVDFMYFGPPEEYEKWAPRGIQKEAYYVDESRPASELAGQAAAALAATSVIFRQTDAAYADLALSHAVELFNFANKFRGSFMDIDDLPFRRTKKWYPSTKFTDEIAWAATWLYAATEDASYFQAAKENLSDDASEYSWDDCDSAAAVLLYQLTGQKEFLLKANKFFTQFLPGGSTKYTAKGLSYKESWGVLRYASNHAFLALAHAASLERYTDGKTEEGKNLIQALRTFATQQINYILGDTGVSYVVGFGKGVTKPYHKSSYNSFIDYPMRGLKSEVQQNDFESGTAQRFILYGGLVGGPDVNDEYKDTRKDYTYSEVTQDYNAGFTGVLAGMIEYYTALGASFTPFNDGQLDLGWSHPNAVQELKPKYLADDCYHLDVPCQKK
ncbi:family 9 glycoside hydrolase [Melampsora americana]|nr:family 9 glycoside hydrolase [Melampsora americana]